MRKRFRILLFAACVGALVVPFGFGFSLESSDVIASPESPIAATVAPAALVVVGLGSRTAPDPARRTIPDSAKLIAIGALLFGMAAVVRKRG